MNPRASGPEASLATRPRGVVRSPGANSERPSFDGPNFNGARSDRAESLAAVARGLLDLWPLGRLPVARRTAASALAGLVAWTLPGGDAYLLANLALAGGLALADRLARRVAPPSSRRPPLVGAAVGTLLALAWVSGPTPLAVVLAVCLFRAADAAGPAPLPAVERTYGPLVRDALAGVVAALLLAVLRASLHTPAAWAEATG